MTDAPTLPRVAGFTGTVLDREAVLPEELRRTAAVTAFRRARRQFLDGHRIDMGALAAELDVNRVTLYRWVGRREELLVRVLWALTEQNLRAQYEVALRVDEPRPDRVAGILTRYVHDILTHPGMTRFLADEGDLAVRLLTVRGPGFQPRLVRAVELLLDEDVDAGVRDRTVPPEDLAYAVVRIIESFVHIKRVTGEDPDPDRPSRILHVLLR